ncbi:MAG: SET domain-containing protein [Polyangiales bacterium]
MAKLEVRETRGRGRGVFAVEPIEEGESIERCHVIVIPEEQLQNVANTILHEYFFRWGGTQDDGAVALGYGSLYNHSDTPNAMYVRKVSEGILEFVALRDIAAGEEIFVSYHGGFGERGPLWFDQR